MGFIGKVVKGFVFVEKEALNTRIKLEFNKMDNSSKKEKA
jgi:hypothetical protein